MVNLFEGMVRGMGEIWIQERRKGADRLYLYQSSFFIRSDVNAFGVDQKCRSLTKKIYLMYVSGIEGHISFRVASWCFALPANVRRINVGIGESSRRQSIEAAALISFHLASQKDEHQNLEREVGIMKYL